MDPSKLLLTHSRRCFGLRIPAWIPVRRLFARGLSSCVTRTPYNSLNRCAILLTSSPIKTSHQYVPSLSHDHSYSLRSYSMSANQSSDSKLQKLTMEFNALVNASSPSNRIKIAQLVNGIAFLPMDKSDYKEILSLIYDFMSKNELDPKEISLISSILRKSTNNEHHSKMILKELDRQLSRFTDLTTLSLSSICGHLGNVSSTPECISLIRNLTSKRFVDTKNINESNLVSLFHSLRMKDSSLPEVRRLIVVITNTLAGFTLPLNANTIARICYNLRDIPCDSKSGDEVKRLVATLAAKMSKCEPRSFSMNDIAYLLYGIRRMKTESQDVLQILNVLHSKIAIPKDAKSPSAKSNLVDIAMALHGLQGMSSELPAVRKLVAYIADNIELSVGVLTGRELGMCLYGLQGLSSKHSEVRLLLKRLQSKISHHPTTLSGQTIGNSLYGMQRMSSDFLEVRSFVAMLAKMIGSSPITDSSMSFQEISNSLYGLQNMHSCYPEVLTLIDNLTAKILRSNPSNFTPQTLSNSVYGMNGLFSGEQSVRNLIRSLLMKFDFSDISNASISAQAVGNTLYGMQCFNNCKHVGQSTATEVYDFIDRVGPIIRSCKGRLSFQQVSNALYGLQNMTIKQNELTLIVNFLYEQLTHVNKQSYMEPSGSGLICVSQILFSLIQILKIAKKDGNAILSEVIKHLQYQLDEQLKQESVGGAFLSISRELCAVLQSLHLLRFFSSNKDISDENLSAISKFIDLMSKPEWKFASQMDSSSVSKFENSVRTFITNELSPQEYDVSFSQVLIYGFHQDVIISKRRKSVEDQSDLGRAGRKIVAIEIDGPSHRQYKKQRYNRLHDIYLKEAHGIATFRIDHRSDNQEQLLKILANVKKELN